MGSDDEFFRVQQALMAHPDFRRWFERLVKIGGCENPVYLTGRTVTSDAATGEVLHVFSSAGQPFNRLMLPCGNRRSSRCVFCSWWYQGDTFHLVLAGLVGGKGVPQSVRKHPRVFMTLTAPSFGPVHTRVENDGKVLPCRARRGGELCPHGVDISCLARHGEDDPALGTPPCAECFDYAGAVLFNAHAGRLWHRFTDDVRRVTLPGVSGLSKREFAAAVRVSFVKVAEYQRRGLVHFHAAVRLDGASGPESEPPPWATEEMLIEALGSSAARVRVAYPDEFGELRELVFGDQFDAKPIRASVGDRVLSDDQVAGYVAKYSTKAAECVGTLDRPIVCRDCKGSGLMGVCPRCGGTGLRVPLEDLPVSEHARALISAAWRLGVLPQYEGLRLRSWAHQCGYGGHFCIKSRVYSVTRGALVDARADYAAKEAGGGQRAPLPVDAVITRDWDYAGSGYRSLIEAQFAAQVRALSEQNRQLSREALADDPAYQDAKARRRRRGRDAA
ncbi:replication initiation protein [Actinocrinis puniceicyclus]|uniref:Replication initiation protein n=1 Tax=Actinocrinis puniceicyclus TaxID=977794 RepID=A0A8J7WSZ2_9ACTN|nr:replication initiator [Actinocrinis puniceicyclus]MBS2967038.1 replication initiation protein [Actinocrinis puniceicyclus]